MSAWTTPLKGHCSCKATQYTLDPNVSVTSEEMDAYEKLFGVRRAYFSFFDRTCTTTTSPPITDTSTNTNSKPGVGESEGKKDCSDCRRSTSSLAVAWLIIPTSFLKFTPESPLKTYTSNSSNVERKFCGECGTTFTYWAWDRAVKTKCIDLTIATLCEEDLARLPEIEGMVPTENLWWDSGITWVKDGISKCLGKHTIAYKSGLRAESSKVDIEF